MKRAVELLIAAWLILMWPAFATPPNGSPPAFTDPFGGAALAVQPDEMLPDPALEKRARSISAGLRCLVCQNQSIDDSDAGLAKDLRILVRDRLKAGDDDAAVLDYVVARYGEFVLLRPRFEASTLFLWGAPLLILLVGGAYALHAGRAAKPVGAGSTLSPEEESRVERLLRERGTNT